MKRNHLLIVALSVLFLPSLFSGVSAQVSPPAETLSGRVVASADGLPLLHTRIWIFEALGTRGYTPQQNSRGEFSIVLPEGYYFVFIAEAGCVPYAKEIWLRPGHPIKLMVRLDLDVENMQDSRKK
jgi:hypothetical protein